MRAKYCVPLRTEVAPKFPVSIIGKLQGTPFCPAVELVRARPSSKHGLQSGSAAVLTAKCIDLDTRLLDGCRLGRQVQNALSNSAGYIQAIDNVLIIVLPLTICAGINLLFRGE